MASPEVKVRITAKNDSAAAFQSLESSLTRIQSAARSLAGVLGVSLSVAAVTQFLRKSVDESGRAEAALTRLRVAVQNAGGDFTKLSPRVDTAVEALQRLTRFEDDDARDALATMITLTGNAEGSLRNLGLAADVAAKTQKPLGEAAQIVGLAMDGNVKALRRLGIQVKDSKTAIEELRKSYSGFAEADGKTFQGRTEQLSNAFHNLQEAIGNVLTKQDSLGGAVPQLTGLFQDLTKAVEKNEDAIRTWVRTITAGIIGAWRVAYNSFNILADNMIKTIADLVVFAGTAINTLLVGPINSLLDALDQIPGVNIPLRAMRVQIEGAQAISEKSSAKIIENWGDIKDAINDVVKAYGSVGAAAATAVGGGGGGGSSGAVTDEMIKKLTDAVALFGELSSMRELDAKELDALRGVYERITAALANKNLTDEQQLKLLKAQRQAVADLAAQTSTSFTGKGSTFGIPTQLGRPKASLEGITFGPDAVPAATSDEPTPTGQFGGGQRQRFGKDMKAAAQRAVAAARDAIEGANDALIDLMKGLRDTLAQGITDALGDGIANGFAAALGKGGIGAGFKALTQTLLGGIGRAMVEFGKASLAASTLMLKIKAALASLNPVAAIAASLALIAIGGLLSGAAASAFGGSSASGYSARGLTDTITRVVVSPTPASQSAASITPQKPIVYAPVFIGKDDQQAQRQLVEMLNLAAGRGHKVKTG